MPGPLKKAYDFATTPLVPKGAIEPIQDAIDSPSLERSPWEARLRGFGAGALEGLRGMTSPVDIATTMVPALRAGKAGGAVRGLAESAPAIAAEAAPAAEMVAQGAEGAWNAARPVARKVMDPIESIYQTILQQGGRNPARMRAMPANLASEAGKMTPEAGLMATGALGGLAYYGGKLAKKLMDTGSQVNKAVNPFQKYSDVLTPEEQQRLAGR